MINFKHEFLVMAIFLSITAAGIVQNKDNAAKISENNYTIYNNATNTDTNINKIIEKNVTLEKEKAERKRLKDERKRIEKLYNKSNDSNIVTYTFNTGEIIELNKSSIINLSEITNGADTNSSIEPGGLRYITSAEENNTDIIFMGNKYEKILPDINNLLFPIIFEIKNKTLIEGEIFNLKGNYGIVVNESFNDNQSVKLRIIKNNITLREIIRDNRSILDNNKTIEWWEYLNNIPGDYRKRKVISINISNINDTEVVADITQYGSKKILTVGNTIREFKIINMTEKIIVMENSEYVRLDKYRKFSIGRLTLYID